MTKDFSMVGVDVGGTSICVGLVRNGSVVEWREAQTNAQRGAGEILQTLVSLIESVVQHDTAGIGIGVPGLVDVTNGRIFNVNNIPAWRNYDLQQELARKFSLPIYINNDANCFALGELHFGSAKGASSLVAITLGTGVGAGIIANGQLHTGILGCAGEIGGLPYLDADFEAYCSNKFFQSHFGMSGKECFLLAEAGNEVALSAFNSFGTHLGKLLSTVLFVMAPDKIILGGTVAKGSKYFKAAMMQEMRNFPYKPILERVTVDYSNISNSAIFGAAALVLNNMERR